MSLLRANTVVINTGNIISSKELKKKATQSPSEEVFDTISSTFHNWLKSVDENPAEGSDCIKCVGPDAAKIDNSDRCNLKISIKIFLEEFSSENLKSAILEVMEALDVTTIDSLILALPLQIAEERVLIDPIKPLWTVLEEFTDSGKIVTIGVSDLDTPELTELYEWTRVKPSINQVNLVSCCMMPTEMVAFAKDNDIQLLTHNDPQVILPMEMLQKILEPGVPNPKQWKSRWIVRYSVVVRSRGIIQNKGYLFCAVK